MNYEKHNDLDRALRDWFSLKCLDVEFEGNPWRLTRIDFWQAGPVHPTFTISSGLRTLVVRRDQISFLANA
jgi:hypothetical protein